MFYKKSKILPRAWNFVNGSIFFLGNLYDIGTKENNNPGQALQYLINNDKVDELWILYISPYKIFKQSYR